MKSCPPADLHHHNKRIAIAEKVKIVPLTTTANSNASCTKPK